MNEVPLWQRSLGVVIIFAGLLLYHSPDSSAWGSFAISLLFISGAALVTRAWLAIALACAFFSWLQVVNQSSAGLLLWYFVCLAVVTSSFSLYVLSERFRARITATRAARWASRSPPSSED